MTLLRFNAFSFSGIEYGKAVKVFLLELYIIIIIYNLYITYIPIHTTATESK